MKSRAYVAILGLAIGIIVVSDAADVLARARGGGGSSGGRGSRSFSSPVAPSTPSSPSRSFNSPAPAPSPSPMAPQRPSMFRGLMGGLAGFAIGGLIGSMLFGGMGHGFGIGMMDILLIGAGVALLIMFLRRRRADTPQPAYAGMGGAAYRGADDPTYATAATAVAEPPVADVERGIAYIRQMDPGFDPDALVGTARDTFFDVQAALTARDMGRVREAITPELFGDLQRQCDELRASARTNRMERVDIRRSEITEAWQESGRDYATVYLAGSLLDYTVDDASGSVVTGSATQRETFEEFWTFVRPVGPGAWRLSAIQTK